MVQLVTIKHLSISVVFKISHNIICSILLIKFRPSQHVRLRAMRFKSRLIEGTFLGGTTFILEMKVIRGLTKYLRRVSKLLQIGRCHFDFLQGKYLSFNLHPLARFRSLAITTNNRARSKYLSFNLHPLARFRSLAITTNNRARSKYLSSTGKVQISRDYYQQQGKK